MALERSREKKQNNKNKTNTNKENEQLECRNRKNYDKNKEFLKSSMNCNVHDSFMSESRAR